MAKKPSPAGRAPSQRQLRVGEVIRHAIANMLQRGDIHDPAMAGHIVTVPEVRLSPDLKLATVYIMPLGGKDEPLVIEALNRHKGLIRSEVARNISMKFAPELRFRRDETFDEADRITRLLVSPAVKRDLAFPAKPGLADAGDDTSGEDER